MQPSLESLLGVQPPVPSKAKIAFSFLFFSDVREDVSNAEKYHFMRDVTMFADREGFEAVYIPERHFSEFGSIYANPAIMASYLIPQTSRIRFRTAGVSVPLHHPAEVVENWAMNDVLSGGRIDLGFGSGWNFDDFVLAPDAYDDRRAVCHDRIPIIQQLWRGEAVTFPGPQGKTVSIRVFPRPVQPELKVWMLVAQSVEGFRYAGQQGYNVFTMLYGYNLEALKTKIDVYRHAREEAGLRPDDGVVTLMLHTMIDTDPVAVERAVEQPFKQYIKTALKAHVKAAQDANVERVADLGEAEEEKMLAYAYQRYARTGALFGTVEQGASMVDEAIAAGVDEIACLVDFGVDYQAVKGALPHLKQLVAMYR
uniref:Putative flavin-dependent oxygenase n=1 Tax=uncultured bacterial symbiont of Discodermia dissoluta TaxID=323654 RepID=Q49HJ7_9BACT|nr:putative flavin-dependent oxygenase [uncultured bacterial symbiont of Discodermia dissoluta]